MVDIPPQLSTMGDMQQHSRKRLDPETIAAACLAGLLWMIVLGFAQTADRAIEWVTVAVLAVIAAVGTASVAFLVIDHLRAPVDRR